MRQMYGKIFSEEENDLDYVKQSQTSLRNLGIPAKIKGNIVYFSESYVDRLPKDGEGCPYMPVNNKLGVPFSLIMESDLKMANYLGREALIDHYVNKVEFDNL